MVSNHFFLIFLFSITCHPRTSLDNPRAGKTCFPLLYSQQRPPSSRPCPPHQLTRVSQPNRAGCRVALPGTLTASCGWKVGELVLVIRCARKLCYLLLSCFGFLRQIQVSQSCFCEIVLSVTILLVNSAQFLAHLQLFWKVSVKMVAEMTPGWNWPWSIFPCEFDSRDQL